MKKKRQEPCKGCIWQKRINEEVIFCLFPNCVKGKIQTGQQGGQNGRAGEKGVGG